MASLPPGPQPKRDFESCKVIFGTAVRPSLSLGRVATHLLTSSSSSARFSMQGTHQRQPSLLVPRLQMLRARFRRSFAPSMFQVIPLRDLGGAPRFENIIMTGSRVDRWDRELMRDQDNVLFLRQDANNYELNHFLGILVSLCRTRTSSAPADTRIDNRYIFPTREGTAGQVSRQLSQLPDSVRRKSCRVLHLCHKVYAWWKLRYRYMEGRHRQTSHLYHRLQALEPWGLPEPAFSFDR